MPNPAWYSCVHSCAHASMRWKILSHNLIKADWISLQVYREAIDGLETRIMMVLGKTEIKWLDKPT